MIKVANCPCSLDTALKLSFFEECSSGPLVGIAAQALRISKKSIESVRVLRRSIDARKKSNVHFVLTLAVTLIDSAKERSLIDAGLACVHLPYQELEIPRVQDVALRPVVVGLGPAGLFAALYLARAGLRPIVVERGACVEKRQAIVQAFNEGANLDLASNIQFGEGGAGTFSDGKLTTGTKNPLGPHVLHWFYDAGAPEDILIDAKPHIGSDVLPGVVRTMREQIIEAGGEIFFETRLVDVSIESGHLASVELEDAAGKRCSVRTDALLLACGHSARDTFAMLFDKGLMMEQKPFSLGVRIEHLQHDVDISQYGRFADHPALGASEYKMAVHVSPQRSAYTFCMCPGGEVVCAASEDGGIVTNGMSNRARDGVNANAALLVNVEPSDFEGSHPLAGMELQRKVERAAFDSSARISSDPYRAPAQTVGDFLSGTGGTPSKRINPSYARGVNWIDLHDILPGFVSETLQEALPLFERKLAGFASPYAVMTAPETRSSSPVRICRNAALQSFMADDPAKRGVGIFPCGEGPGYAGGIMSAAADGLRVASQLAANLASQDCLQSAISALKRGGVVVLPTDTIYGVGLSVLHASGPEAIFKLKERLTGKPIAWLVDSPEALHTFGDTVPESVMRLAKKYWPGPLTIIVKASSAVPTPFCSEDGTIGLRMPANQTALRIIHELGSPLAVSSANISGAESPKEIDRVSVEILDRVDAFVVDNETRSGQASTVLSCIDGTVHVLREGDIDIAAIESCMQG